MSSLTCSCFYAVNDSFRERAGKSSHICKNLSRAIAKELLELRNELDCWEWVIAELKRVSDAMFCHKKGEGSAVPCIEIE